MGRKNGHRFWFSACVYGAAGALLLCTGCTPALPVEGAFECTASEEPPYTAMAAVPPFVFLVELDETHQLAVFGTDAEGVMHDVTAAGAGTTYHSRDPDVVSVDKDGLLLAVSIGQTVVDICHAGMSSQVAVTVEQGHGEPTP